MGNQTSPAALCIALFGGIAGDWVGPGTGVTGDRLDHKAAVVEAAVALHRPVMTDPFEVLRCLGGLELAAIAGPIMAARLRRGPGLLDGFALTPAAARLPPAGKRAPPHCILGPRPAGPRHPRAAAPL